MCRAWYGFVLFCCACNAVIVGAAWYNGEPAWWFVWLSSITFSINFGISCLCELLEAA